MTLDAVGGVWRYALDTATALAEHDITCLLVGLGPPPGAAQLAGAAAVANAMMVWRDDLMLDWMANDPAQLMPVTSAITGLARDWDADVLHLNLPSQAAGLAEDLAVVTVTHSCVPTWWQAVRGSVLPAEWEWLRRQNAAGFRRAQAVLAPSASHASATERAYGHIERLGVVHNATLVEPAEGGGETFVLAAGRWWDEAKNGEVLDAAAALCDVPIVMAGATQGPNGAAARFERARTSGSLDRTDLLALMRRAAIFAAPSRYEPFGLAVAEAALCGCALVLADIPTFRELWNGAAVFCPVDDAKSWAETFVALLAAPVQRRSLAAMARARAACLTSRRQADALQSVYQRVLAPQRAVMS